MTPKRTRIGLAVVLVAVLIAGGVLVVRSTVSAPRTTVTAYFDNSNGLFAGDDILILGVPVGKVDKIEPQPQRAKVTFWVDARYPVPADAMAAILSPQLVTGRAIQLTPAYTTGPVMADNAVIPQDRTVVPVSWDDLREQLAKLTQTLQPTEPGGVSELGAFINTVANHVRGEGGNIRDALTKLAQTFSVVGDHSDDIFSTLRNLSTLVSALHDNTGLLAQLNGNLAAVTGLLANDPDEVGQAIADLHTLAGDVRTFVADNRDAIGITSDRLASVSQAINDSLDDIKQALHVAPTTLANFNAIYEPANGALTGALAVNNFANPISFICGAIQAASRLNAEQSSKLCVQYLAPVVKNRQFNFPPLGEDLFVGPQARPNEVTYSEDWMRPDYIPPVGTSAPAQVPPATLSGGAPASPVALPAEAPDTTGASQTLPTVATDPAAGLPGMMQPAGGGR
jgi:phospholipid/cholesterol/gamma-HCH transport system substrate-binding protein